jgi:hypothetical protein
MRSQRAFAQDILTTAQRGRGRNGTGQGKILFVNCGHWFWSASAGGKVRVSLPAALKAGVMPDGIFCKQTRFPEGNYSVVLDAER